MLTKAYFKPLLTPKKLINWGEYLRFLTIVVPKLLSEEKMEA